MGLFDLDEYKAKKARADQCATPPRDFPVVLADVNFDGRMQKLRFEPMLLDGGQVFISFRPESSGLEHTLIAGGYDELYERPFDVTGFPRALLIYTDHAFDAGNWLPRATQAVEAGHFGRLIVVEEGGKFVYQFFGSTGVVDEEDYHFSVDGSRTDLHFLKDPDYERPQKHHYWAWKEEAADLLIRLDADAFAKYLKRQKADPASVYGLSLRWDGLSRQEKREYLPAIEKEIEPEICALMRAIILSEPLTEEAFSAKDYRGGTWELDRLWVRPSASRGFVMVGEAMITDSSTGSDSESEQLAGWIDRMWPLVVEHFLPRVEQSKRERIYPTVEEWMRYGRKGAYIVDIEPPTAHERVEALLHLRDFLATRGLSPVEINAKLKHR